MEGLRLAPLPAVAALMMMPASAPAQSAAAAAPPESCGNAGLKLPPGFCATLFADELGSARDMAIAPNGVVYLNTWSRHRPGARIPAGGFLVALQDSTGSGRANRIERFGPTQEEGARGGVGIALFRNALYVEESDRIERYRLSPDSIVPSGTPEVIVSGLPLGGDHPMHPFAIDAEGHLYVDVATATNACQARNRQLHAPGNRPCTELETRGGIWRFDANTTAQKFSPAQRYATGIRNGEGIAIDASGRTVYVTQHGRDQLHQNWPELYRPEEEATLPAEEVVRLREGGDYGWPECYYDPIQAKLVLAPEYGGDGGRTVGECAAKLAPVAALPAHWAPDDMVIYTGTSFPQHYRNGAFIAFHGSWDRAPYPQGGYNVVFQALGEGAASARCEVFADGFAGEYKEPARAAHRPAGVAVDPHGALYVSDDKHGSIFRIVYQGGDFQGGSVTACPAPAAPAGPSEEASLSTAVAEASKLPVPSGSSAEQVALGDEVFHGRGGATCAACHGADGRGSETAPDLTRHTPLWGDGSLQSITGIVKSGVPHPRQYAEPMPPMGGAQLTPEELAAVGAYVWGLSHR